MSRPLHGRFDPDKAPWPNEMDSQAQREALAKACPETITCIDYTWYYLDKGVMHRCKNNDPLQDLNAMHEVEKSKELWCNSDYAWWLGRICCLSQGFNPDKIDEVECLSMAICATAAQRAEAILRTLNLWKE